MPIKAEGYIFGEFRRDDRVQEAPVELRGTVGSCSERKWAEPCKHALFTLSCPMLQIQSSDHLLLTLNPFHRPRPSRHPHLPSTLMHRCLESAQIHQDQ